MKTYREYLLPSLIASVFMSTYVIIDGIFIGYNLNDIGLAAINIAWPINALLQSMGLALGISSGIYLTRLEALGKIDIKKRLMLGLLLILTIVGLLMGLILFFLRNPLLVLFGAKGETLDSASRYITIILYGAIFEFLGLAIIPLNKNIGHVRLAMLASISSTIINFILDYILIVAFKLGLEGAAIASVIGEFSCFIIGVIPFIKSSKGFLVTKEAIKEVFLGSVAPFILNYSYAVLIIITNALAMEYGNEGAVAAYTVLSYLLYVINALSSGSADAIQPLFSYNIEINKHKKNKTLLIKTLIISFILVMSFNVIFLILKNPIGILYGLTTYAKEIYDIAFIYYFIGFIFISISKVLCSYFYSINKKILANIFVLIEPLLLTPLLYLIFINIMGLTGLWISFMIVQIILAIALVVSILFHWRKLNGRIFDSQQA